MTRLEKCELLKSKGYIYDLNTGNIYGVSGNQIIRKNKNGYIILHNKKFDSGNLLAHHFAWYMTYGNVDFIELDHENRIRDDNRICNLRILDRQGQQHNRDAKGYYWKKDRNKWRAEISFNGKNIHLGYYNTEEEARQSYLSAKSKYHII